MLSHSSAPLLRCLLIIGSMVVSIDFPIGFLSADAAVCCSAVEGCSGEARCSTTVGCLASAGAFESYSRASVCSVVSDCPESCLSLAHSVAPVATGIT